MFLQRYLEFPATDDHWVDQTNKEGEERRGQDCPQALFSFFMSFEIWEERGGGIIAQCNPLEIRLCINATHQTLEYFFLLFRSSASFYLHSPLTIHLLFFTMFG